MKLATLDSKGRDGSLVVVSSCNKHFAEASSIAKNLQDALDRWKEVEPKLLQLSEELCSNPTNFPILELRKLRAPLPRAYEWIDGSAFLNHVELVRKARGATMPPSFLHDPLVYQGGSGCMLGPYEDIELADESWGCDFESEVCVVLGDTPARVKASEAGQYVKLLMLVNDVSLRNLIPNELEKGFGFFVSKPASAFSPFAITPDELGDSWKQGRVHLPLKTTFNGKVFGQPNAGSEMHFSFFDLIEHITKTRSYTAGTILGSGTISNKDQSVGSSCIAEVRMIEKIERGEITTPFMKDGDLVEIEMFDKDGDSLFGCIKQRVRKV